MKNIAKHVPQPVLKRYKITKEPKHAYVEKRKNSEYDRILNPGDIFEGYLETPWIRTEDGFYVLEASGRYAIEVQD